MKKRYNQITLEERDKIAIMKAKGCSIREIGRVLKRSHSSILRELKRNTPPLRTAYYLPSKAHERTVVRRRKSRRLAKLKSSQIRSYVEEKLKLSWSPEQISGRLPLEMSGLRISHESIYQYVYSEARHLVCYLTRRHWKRFKRGHSRKHQSSHIPNRIGIEQRPESIQNRNRFGHWESDTVESTRDDKTSLNVIVERKSRFVQITKMKDKSASETKRSITNKLQTLPKKATRSITYDNGHENTLHEKINEHLNSKSYFCKPFHSWEKGTVENTNGLIRRFIPKGYRIKNIKNDYVKIIETKLNQRPRKCLGFRTPAEVFDNFTGALTR